MTPLERFRATMNYEKVDQAPLREFGAWPETVERWKREGFETGIDYFGNDHWEGGGSIWFWPTPPFERKVISEDDEYITYVDSQGIILKELKNNPMSSMPQFIRFPVETREDFRKFWKERMQPDLTERAGPDWKEQLRKHRNRDYPFIIIADRWGGFFGPIRNLTGVEHLCELFYDDPAFVEEMMDADAQFLIAIISQILEHTDIDIFGFWEDMAYKTAPLISPEMVRKYMLPRYKKVVDFARSRGVHHFSLDSDGYIDPLIPIWIEAGIDIICPFEVQAGMDVVAVRRKYGKDLRMWGGVDKRALAKGPRAIDAELKRIEPLVREGGYIPTLDHTATPDISWENYRYFMEELKRLL